MSRIEPPSTRPLFRGVSPILLLDVMCPVIVYQLVAHFFPALSVAVTLAIAASCPAISFANSIARRRLPDVMGLVAVAAIVVTSVAVLVGVDSDLIFTTIAGTTGSIFLLSLCFPRPLVFFLGREFTTMNNPQWIAEYNGNWQRTRAPFEFRLMTLVWGLGLTFEFAVQILLFLVFPRTLFNTLSPLLKTAVYLGIMVWTVVYVRRIRRRWGEGFEHGRNQKSE